ncbi:MAG: hypothetical protein K6G18_12515 [Treponema sp.]|nr:hypothetical protein [Treponema sp.]
MNVKDAVDVGGSAFADKASIQMELERNRKKGSLTSYIRGLEIFDDIKLREVWKLLTEQERTEYKTWDTVTNDFFACRNEYSEQDGAFKPVDKSVCYENIFRLMKSYEAEGKTLELKIALDIMQADEKKSYAMRSRRKKEQLLLFQ